MNFGTNISSDLLFATGCLQYNKSRCNIHSVASFYITCWKCIVHISYKSQPYLTQITDGVLLFWCLNDISHAVLNETFSPCCSTASLTDRQRPEGSSVSLQQPERKLTESREEECVSKFIHVSYFRGFYFTIII